MPSYVANLKFSRVWSVEIEANSLEEAEGIAQATAEYNDNALDINERECVVLVGVEEVEEDSKAEARPYAPEKTINDIKREGEESE